MTIVNGRERQLRKGKGAKAFKVLTIQCKRCGSTTDYKDTEKYCQSCRKELDTHNLKAKTIDKGQVTEILSNEMGWKCLTCGRFDKTPQRCCLEEWVFRPEDYVGRKPIPAFQCSECLILYKKPIVCHSGAMMFQGNILPNRSDDEFATIKKTMEKRLGSHRMLRGMVQ